MWFTEVPSFDSSSESDKSSIVVSLSLVGLAIKVKNVACIVIR